MVLRLSNMNLQLRLVINKQCGGIEMNQHKFFQAAVVASLATAAVVTVAPVVDAAFNDVKPNTEGAIAIEKLSAMKIVNGYEDGTFRPGNGVTRAEAAKILTLLNTGGEEVSGYQSSFKDVPRGHWAYNYVSFANKFELLTGYGGGLFGTNDPLTRGQFAKILATQLAEPTPNIALPFKDVPKGAWFEDGVKVLLDLGITKGTTATTFSPNAPITREQLAIFLDRANLLDDIEVPDTTIPVSGNSDFAQFMKPNAVNDAEALQQLVKLVKTLGGDIEAANYYYAPEISASYIQDFAINEGKFLYTIYVPVQGDRFDYYHMFVDYKKDGPKSFELLSAAAFASEVKKENKGAVQLQAFINGLKKGEEYEDVYILPAGYDDIGMLYYDNSPLYFEFPTLQKQVFFVYHDSMMRSDTYAFELTPSYDGERYTYTQKQLQPYLTYNIPANYDVSYVDVQTAAGEQVDPVFDINYGKPFVLYALDPYNTAPTKGATVTITLHNFETDNEIEVQFVYNGTTFVKQ